MANVHGFNDLNNRPNGNNNGLRQPMIGGADSSPLMTEEIRQNKVPFMNTLASDRPPL